MTVPFAYRERVPQRLLARSMDGYTFTGVDDALATIFVQHRQLLVLTAWQIAAAASGSEAAGL